MDTLERIPFETKKATFKKLLKAAEIESLNSGDRRRYDKMLKDYRDYVNTVEYAKVEGIEIGMEKGKLEGKLEGIKAVALRLKKSGVSLSLIMQTTGLSPKEIKRL